MDKPVLSKSLIKKINSFVVLGVAMTVVGLSGCSSSPVKPADSTTAPPKKSEAKQSKVEVKKPIQVAQAPAARAGKDKHQIEYEQKRLKYHQEWERQQDARAEWEERQAIKEAEARQWRQANPPQRRAVARVATPRAAPRQPQYQAQAQDYAVQDKQYVLEWERQQQLQQQQRQQSFQEQQVQQVAQAQQQGQWQSRQQQVQQQQAQRRQQQQQQYAQQQYASNFSPAYGNGSVQLVSAALNRLRHRVTYNGAYIPLSYPNGDVPANIGVCTDTVIRAYRRLGIDLQSLVHEDMSQAFHAYPNLPKWGLQAPDPNIDHRRVHNLKTFFSRHGQRLPVTNNPNSYRPGDLVTWYLGGDQEHIGIVVNVRSPADPNRYMIVHNISDGEKMEDVLFKMPISGHYRYFPNSAGQLASAQY